MRGNRKQRKGEKKKKRKDRIWQWRNVWSALRQAFLGAPHSHKECQCYSYLSHVGTQASELTEAKESAYCHVRFSSHSDSGITW